MRGLLRTCRERRDSAHRSSSNDLTTEQLLRGQRPAPPRRLARRARGRACQASPPPRRACRRTSAGHLPRTWLDDINLLRSGSSKAARVEQLMLSSLEDTLAMRGFGCYRCIRRVLFRKRHREGHAAASRKHRQHGERIWVAAGEDIGAMVAGTARRCRLSIAGQGGELRVRLKAEARPVATGTAGAVRADGSAAEANPWHGRCPPRAARRLSMVRSSCSRSRKGKANCG